MKVKMWTLNLGLVLGLLAPLGFAQPRRAVGDGPLKYTLTIYVDEGRGDLSGHVFVDLSDGKNHLFRGFYANEAVTDVFTKAPALIGAAGGEVRDDSGHRWNVKRTYNITKS